MKENTELTLSAKAKWATILTGEELGNWFGWLKTKGGDNFNDYAFRCDPCSTLQKHISDFIEGIDSPKILDVGSGPLTVVGKRFNGKKLDVQACDALGNEFHHMCANFGVKPAVEVINCEAEELSDVFNEDQFDVVYAQNSIDQCHDPVAAIEEMLKVAKPGGVVLLLHKKHEDESYEGNRQWNFRKIKDRCFLLGKGFDVCLDDMFADTANVGTVEQDDFLFTIIERKETVEVLESSEAAAEKIPPRKVKPKKTSDTKTKEVEPESTDA